MNVNGISFDLVNANHSNGRVWYADEANITLFEDTQEGGFYAFAGTMDDDHDSATHHNGDTAEEAVGAVSATESATVAGYAIIDGLSSEAGASWWADEAPAHAPRPVRTESVEEFAHRLLAWAENAVDAADYDAEPGETITFTVQVWDDAGDCAELVGEVAVEG